MYVYTSEYFVNLKQCQHRKHDYTLSCGVKYTYLLGISHLFHVVFENEGRQLYCFINIALCLCGSYYT